MMATIFVSLSPEKNKEETQKYLTTIPIDPADILIEDVSGISEVKQLQKDAFFVPLKSQYKALIVPHAENLTIPAQNALLKLLEEPPEHLYIFLLATTLESLLPTIQSRCRIIKREEDTPPISDEEKEEMKQHLSILQTGTIGEKLFLAQHLSKEKEGLVTFLHKAEQVLHEQLVEKRRTVTRADEARMESLVTLLTHLMTLKEIVTTTNVSPRMALESMVLSLQGHE